MRYNAIKIQNKTLRAPMFAKSFIMSLKSTVLAMSLSILRTARSVSLSWVMVLRMKFLISFKFLKSALQMQQLQAMCRIF